MINNSGKPSIDDAIMDFLSKKSVVDQTEKLVFARISTKIQANYEELSASIQRLSSKNFIRRVYPQGKVGYELTPKGKISLENQSKAEAARITQKLKEAIQQERKTKLTLAAISRLQSSADEWQSYQIPDIKLADGVLQEATQLFASIKETEAQRPICDLNPNNYDQEFAQYTKTLEKLVEQNKNLNRKIRDYAQIKDRLPSISTIIENLNKAINKYELLTEATAKTDKLKFGLTVLKSIQTQLEDFPSDTLARLDEVKAQLGNTASLLETLRKPTHEFVPVKRGKIEETVVLYPDPELPIKYSRKTNDHPLSEKCIKCGTTRKSTPVNLE